MAVHGAQQKIHETISSWPGVTAHPHCFGGTEYRLGKRELGHIHGDQLVDIPFPKKVRDEIITAGRADPHHVLPDSGWISFYLNEPADVEQAIGLFRQSFELAARQWSQKHSGEQKESKMKVKQTKSKTVVIGTDHPTKTENMKNNQDFRTHGARS